MPLSKNHPKMPLGREVPHSRTYNPGQLYPVPRAEGRAAEGLAQDALTRCFGEDIWNLYEISWLDNRGKPEVAMAEARVPFHSPNLIESKSLKLYLNSLHMTVFTDAAAVRATMARDLSQAAGQPVQIRLWPPDQFGRIAMTEPHGVCIDHHPMDAPAEKIATSGLTSRGPAVRETLFSRLFRSICPVTGQPDHATISIAYQGRRIHPQGLLCYLVSFREHPAFHESCTERIFSDILQRCKPARLIVSARFMRRGGIDINPYRATHKTVLANVRDFRQ